MMYPLVRELAEDGIPVTVTCRVLKIARQPYYRWLINPVTDSELEQAYRANALFAAHRDDPEFGYRFLVDEAREAGQPMAERTAWRICSQQGWWSAFGKKRGKTARGPARRSRRPVRRDRRQGPPAARVHRRRRQRAVAHRHHRAPHRAGHALPVRDQGRLLQPDRGLLHRLPDEVTPRGGGAGQRRRQAR